MISDNPNLLESLRKICHKLAGGIESAEDLMQVARRHLSLIEVEQPDKSLKWYTQSCRFCLRNHLSRGCSVDSEKRRLGRRALPNESNCEDGPEITDSEMELDGDDSVISAVGAREIKDLLSSHLKGREQEVFLDLAAGLKVKESATKRGLSQQMVGRIRLKIQRLARQFGILPLAQPSAASFTNRCVELPRIQPCPSPSPSPRPRPSC